jgi:hypothetical protein
MLCQEENVFSAKSCFPVHNSFTILDVYHHSMWQDLLRKIFKNKIRHFWWISKLGNGTFGSHENYIFTEVRGTCRKQFCLFWLPRAVDFMVSCSQIPRRAFAGIRTHRPNHSAIGHKIGHKIRFNKMQSFKHSKQWLVLQRPKCRRHPIEFFSGSQFGLILKFVPENCHKFKPILGKQPLEPKIFPTSI